MEIHGPANKKTSISSSVQQQPGCANKPKPTGLGKWPVGGAKKGVSSSWTMVIGKNMNSSTGTIGFFAKVKVRSARIEIMELPGRDLPGGEACAQREMAQQLVGQGNQRKGLPRPALKKLEPRTSRISAGADPFEAAHILKGEREASASHVLPMSVSK